MSKLMVMALCEPDGGVTLRICRPRNGENENDPLQLEHGVLDIPLNSFEMAEIHSAICEALWDRVRKAEIC